MFLQTHLQKYPQGLTIITGEIGSGKTTWCKNALLEASQLGLKPAGLITPGIYENGEKIGIQMLNISNGESRVFGKQRKPDGIGVLTLHWQFDPNVFVWGNQILKNLPVNDLLVIDELGPLEFFRQEGLMAAFDVLDTRQYKKALVVIRPHLVDKALERWQDAQVLDISSE